MKFYIAVKQVLFNHTWQWRNYVVFTKTFSCMETYLSFRRTEAIDLLSILLESSEHDGESFGYWTCCATLLQDFQRGFFGRELRCSINQSLVSSIYPFPPSPPHSSGSQLPSCQCLRNLHPKNMVISDRFP